MTKKQSKNFYNGNIIKETPEKYLLPKKNISINWENTENIYIEGDNLDGLNILLKEYKNKIRVIYIDPPYNTGKDFIYKDNFKNSDWASMIYPRLKIARELLSEDGIIFISIDDNEICNLKSICKDIFGCENFISQFIYEKTQHFGRQKLNVYSNAEYVLCFAKQLYNSNMKIKELLVEKIVTELEDAPLYNSSNNLTKLRFTAGKVRFKLKDGYYNNTSDTKYKLLSEVEVKDGVNKNDLELEFKSRWSQNKINKEIENGTTFLVKSDNFAIRAVYKKGKTSNRAPKQIIFTNSKNEFCTYNRFGERVKTSETATKSIEKLMGKCYFSYPKPVSLITYLISLIYDPKSDSHPNDFTVLDFFSGSGTTAEAVMQLNAQDNGKRKYILIQQPELCDKKTETFKAGYKNLCELGEKRIKKASEYLSEINPSIDTGLKIYSIQ